MEATFPRTLDSLAPLFDFIAGFVARNRIGEADAYALTLAIEEVFVNVVRYSAGSTDGVAVSLSRETDTVVVKLTDFGAGSFDLTRVARVDNSLPLAARRPGGLGIHLARSVMDEIKYQHDSGRSITTLVKRLGATRV